MDIIRNRPQTAAAPAQWFTGTAYIDGLAPSDKPSELRAYRVHFSPSARTAWHSHPRGQLLHITDGVARVQSQGGPIEEVKAGDTVRIGPGELHWHGAAPGHFMTHIALQMSGEDGSDANWGELVSDAEFEGPAG
jgi:quercetin dioxygenase-like cupin family protein